MRALHLITLALLATAARADIIQPCQLTVLGSGVTCTEGLLTFSLSSSAPPDTIVEPIPGGLALVGEMDGFDLGTSVFFVVTVPKYTAIGSLIGGTSVTLTEDVLAATSESGMAISGFLSQAAVRGQTLGDIEASEYGGPCFDCGVTFYPFLREDFGDFWVGINLVVINASTYGGPAIVTRWAFGGFDAITPEPSTFLLLVTALGLACVAHRRWVS